MPYPSRKINALATVFGLSAALALSACSASSDTSDTSTTADGGLAPVNMAFEWTCSGDWSVVYEGIEQGIFEKNGVSLTYGRGQGGSDTVPLVAAGEYDLGILSAAPVAIGAGQDLPLTVIGAASTVGPVTILADSTIKEPKDLQGRSLAVQTDQFEGAVWDAFVKATGIDGGAVKVVPRDDASEADFLAGKIDALVVFYPTSSTSAILAERPGLTVLPMQQYVPTYGHVFTANSAWLKANPEAAKGFVDAWAESAKWVLDNYDAAYQNLVDNCKEVDPKALKFSMDAYFDSYTAPYSKEHGLGSFSMDGLAETQQVLVNAGLANSKPVADWASEDYQPSTPVLP